VGATGWFVLDEPFGLPMFGLRPGYRLSYLDPTTAYPDDSLVEHTVGIRYDPATYALPIALFVDVTSLWEIGQTGTLKFDNNWLTVLLQINF
jgi:hypothetical protein